MRKYQANVILLAAGQSRRMGDVNKLLLPYKGAPMVRHLAQIYASTFSAVYVVTGYQPQKIIAALSHVTVKIIHNPKHEKGHNTSVATGLHSLKSPQIPTLIALADQPYINRKDLIGLMEFHRIHSAGYTTIPFHKGTRGHPIVVPFEILSRIQSERAAKNMRRFLDENPHSCNRYNAPNDHFIRDIDTPPDAVDMQSYTRKGL